MPYIREDQADIDVTLNGVIYENWASVEGGNLEAQDSKTRPGGMGTQVSVGGPPERQDVTVETQMSDVMLGLHKTFESAVGWGEVQVSYHFLNARKIAYGTTHSVKGILKSAALPDMDSNGNETGMYQIVVSCDELAA